MLRSEDMLACRKALARYSIKEIKSLRCIFKLLATEGRVLSCYSFRFLTRLQVLQLESIPLYSFFHSRKETFLTTNYSLGLECQLKIVCFLQTTLDAKKRLSKL